MKTKFFSLFFLVLLVLVSCSNNESASNNEGGDNTDSEDSPTIHFMTNLLTPNVPNEKILTKVEDATGYNLEIDWVPDNNYNERLNTAFATNSLPDVVGIGFQQIDQFKEAIRDGQFWEIGPYLEDYENLSKLKDEIIDNSKIDGKVYGIYQGRPLSRSGIIYRKDWADNLGLSAPTTTDEFFEMAKAFTEEDPDGNGEDDTIGLTDRSDLIYGSFKTIASWFGTPNYWGVKDDEILPQFMFQEYVDTMDFMKELRDNGYMNKDFPVTSKEDQTEMFKNGTAGLYVGSMSDVKSMYEDASKINPDVEYDVQNYVEGPDGEYGVWSIPGYGSLMLFPKSSVESEEELKDILTFYDYLMTPEVANLALWGEEGVHYELIDGQAKVIDQDKYDAEVRPYKIFEIGEPETSGKYEGYNDYEPALKAKELEKDNENYLIENPTVTLDSETYAAKAGELDQIMTDATYQYILGEMDEEGFEAAIEKWKEAGGQEALQEFNESYQK
ncbi:extracellular solute-binding protein [Gracilibacillus salinarum]|uniref:Extracellular solute-binding protein n=1 Tax=Gracilibacillus salinarum TaxID=2932255 RepID=A0ABY4GQ44_9BACI|nr:extracellular solute-binding protein [Gracilibacillus salinarum]UOQ86472.1 extracellular solute-binding protein [Gracilibacillus salinarum]